MLITNSTVQIETYVEFAERSMRCRDTGTFLLLQDGMEVNSGSFLLRGTREQPLVDPLYSPQHQFLRLWWDMGALGSRLDPTDQASLMLALLCRALVHSGRTPDAVVRDCASKAHYWQLVACWDVGMARLGYPLGARSVGGVVLLPNAVRVVQAAHWPFDPSVFPSTVIAVHQVGVAQAVDELTRSLPELGWEPCVATPALAGPRGFNTINAVDNNDLAWGLHPSQLWHPGDFAVHVTSDPALPHLYSLYTRQLEGALLPQCNPGQTWAVWPACVRRPCVEQLWAPPTAGPPQYHMLSRWAHYTPARGETPPACPAVPPSTPADSTLPMDPATQGHYAARFALEVTQDFRPGVHVYEVVEFRMAPGDHLPSRLFDFVSVASFDWLYFVGMARALAAMPTLLACRPALPAAAPARLLIALNESLPAVIAAVARALGTEPVAWLTSSHIDWTLKG